MYKEIVMSEIKKKKIEDDIVEVNVSGNPGQDEQALSDKSNKSLKERIKYALKYSIHTWIFKCLIIAFVLELILEMLGRRSIFLGFKFMLTSPIVYLYNVSIVFFTLLFALFLKKRIFGIIIISTVWLVCGIVNFSVLGYRVTPFAAIDILMAFDVLSMIDVYLAKWQQVFVLIGIIALVVLLIYLFKRTPRFEGSRKVKGTMLACVMAWVFVWGMTNFAVKHNIISDDFANLGMAYQDYGFAYCFTNSIIDNGISKPDGYDEETMLEIKAELDGVRESDRKKTPNVIVIQLESFFDPNGVEGLSMSENPLPTFTALKEKYPSGYFKVPALGAGTANTEFEVLTALESGFFGAGEYAYKTTVNDIPVEGMCSVFKDEGYGTYAIHNNKSSFYDRKNVYEKMGFDRFISLEYMYDVEYTSTGWAKDGTLVDDIMKCMESTEGQDFVFTISVQAHGKYPLEDNTCESHIQVEYYDELVENQIHYYINQIYEMDLMIADLIERLDKTGEDYLLVLYGDHLPTLELTEEQLPGHTLFQTEYILVNNIGLKIEDEDIAASDLSVKILDALNINGGYAHKAYSLYEDEELRRQKLNLIAYDMLFGEKYLYQGQNAVEDNEITMGVDDIYITGIKNERDHMVILGENFTEYSVVYRGEDALETMYVNRNTLMVEGERAETGESFTVNQVDKSHHVLSISETFVY